MDLRIQCLEVTFWRNGLRLRMGPWNIPCGTGGPRPPSGAMALSLSPDRSVDDQCLSRPRRPPSSHRLV